MSSYFNLYFKTREKEGRPSELLRVMSVSSSHPLYSAFRDEGVTSAYKYDQGEISDEVQYTPITSSMIDNILEEYKDNIKKTKNHIDTMFRLGASADKIEETSYSICGSQEYLDELIRDMHWLEMLKIFTDQSELSWIDVEGVYGNID